MPSGTARPRRLVPRSSNTSSRHCCARRFSTTREDDRIGVGRPTRAREQRDTMGDDRVFGNIATKLLMENDRVRIWEMRLDPGQSSDLHPHENDYIMIQLGGDKIAADFEPDSKDPFGGAEIKHVEGDVVPGNVLWADRGGIETAVNIGNEQFYEIVVELKD